MIGRSLLACLAPLAGLGLASPALGAAPTASVHDLQWYVHVDLIDAGSGRDLGFYQDLVDSASAEASAQLEGYQGPADHPCCTRLSRSVALSPFGSAGDGLDVLDSAAEYTTMTAIGSGSRAFLVDSITYCGGVAPTAVGCAEQPSCDGDGSDDPDLWLVMTMDGFDGGNGTQVLAHERGHNTCLGHVNTTECQLMRPGAGGGCIDAGECANFQAGRTTTSGTCSCQDTSSGLLADGATCSEVVGGLCSGGICGEPEGAGATRLLTAGGAGHGSGETPDDAMLLSGLTGGWAELGTFGGSGEMIDGLTYATDSATLYGVRAGPADDLLVTVDPETGSITATVGTLSNGSLELVALAYDPGPTSAPSDDLLYALETDGVFEDLVTIDPNAPNHTSVIGSLAFGAANGFRGLAYDTQNDKLYASSPFVDGIYEVETGPCSPLCDLTQQAGLGLNRFDASLAWSPDTGMLHLVGWQLGAAPLGPRTLYDVVDPTTFEPPRDPIQVDAFTTSALAAVPEPASALALLAGAAGLLALQRRRRRS